MTGRADYARRAAACFAVARSASLPGEQAAAMNRGMELLRRGGLDPAEFDIPGEPPPSGMRKGEGLGAAWMDAATAGAGLSMDALVQQAIREVLRRRARRAAGLDD